MLGGWLDMLQRTDEALATRRHYFRSNPVATVVNPPSTINMRRSGGLLTLFAAAGHGPSDHCG